MNLLLATLAAIIIVHALPGDAPTNNDPNLTIYPFADLNGNDKWDDGEIGLGAAGVVRYLDTEVIWDALDVGMDSVYVPHGTRFEIHGQAEDQENYTCDPMYGFMLIGHAGYAHYPCDPINSETKFKLWIMSIIN